MAVDPQANRNGNNLMIVGIIAMVVLVGGLLAFLATYSRNTTDDTPPPVSRPTAVTMPTGPAGAALPVAPPAAQLLPSTDVRSTVPATGTPAAASATAIAAPLATPVRGNLPVHATPPAVMVDGAAANRVGPSPESDAGGAENRAPTARRASTSAAPATPTPPGY